MPLVVPTTSQLSEEQQKQVREAFNIFDKNKDGTISREELGRVMRQLGLNPSETQVLDIINSADVDKNGVIDIDEFISLMPALTGGADLLFNNTPQPAAYSTEKKGKTADEEEELRRAFLSFDTNGDGSISAEELQIAMKSVGENLTRDEISAIIHEVDNDGDGKIDYIEFTRLYLGR